jgi:ankyrin repeat protein
MNEQLLSRIFRGGDLYAAKKAIVYCSKPLGHYLELAVHQNRMEIVRFILSQDLDAESHNHMRRSLVFAARHGFTDIVHMLLTNGDDIYVDDEHIQDACHVAVRGKHIAVIRHIAAVENLVIQRAQLYAYNAMEGKDEGMVIALLPLLSRHQIRILITHACYDEEKNIINYILSHRVYGDAINETCVSQICYLAVCLGDRSLFEMARRFAETRLSWLQVRHYLELAARVDRRETVPMLLDEMRNFTSLTLYSAFTTAAKTGSTKVLTELIQNSRSSHYIKYDSPTFMYAAKNGHASCIDILLSVDTVDNCDLSMYKKSGVYKAFRWATKNNASYLLEILVLSNIMWRYSNDDTLLNIQERVLTNERTKLAPYVTLALRIPMFAMTQIIANIETEETLRYHVMAKYGQRVQRLLDIVESASVLLLSKKDRSIAATRDAIFSCQKKRSLHSSKLKRKRTQRLKSPDAKRIHIDLTLD